MVQKGLENVYYRLNGLSLDELKALESKLLINKRKSLKMACGSCELCGFNYSLIETYFDTFINWVSLFIIMAIVESLENQGKELIITLRVNKKEIGKEFSILDNIYLVPNNLETIKSHLVRRGAKESTRYLLIPPKIREKLGFFKDRNKQEMKLTLLSENKFLVEF